MGKHWGHGLCLLFVIMSFVVIANTKICSGAGNVSVGCFAEERLALVRFRRSLTDDYGMLSSWVGKDCCRWEGVGCSGSTGRVVRLHLSGNDLVSGEVNSGLAELKHLRHLDLSRNRFGGSKIPRFMGSFKQLRYLNLSYAGFVGIIPHHLGNLSSLNVLDLSIYYYPMKNLTADDVEWVSRLSSLQHLRLSEVDLGGAKNIDKLFHIVPSLIEVRLSECSLSKAQAQLSPLHLNSSSTLSKIQFLDLSWNFIDSPFLSFLHNMTSLEFLDLSGFNLGDQPYSFVDLLNMLPSLSELRLSECSLNNTHLYPTYLNFSTLSRIQNLDLSFNSFGGEFPSLLTNTSSLRILDLSWNLLNSSIPESLGKLIGLKVLNLAWNELTGLIPTSFGKLTELEELHLESNQLTGLIPTSFGKLTELEELHLESNQLTGPIPTSFGKLTELEELHLESNQLTGPIPTSFGKLTEMEVLHLDSNQLTGLFPVWLSQLTKLTSFDVSSNYLEGSVSETHFANLSRLEELDMSSNPMLTFNISPEWKPSFQLRSLRLCSSKIVQEFPHWIRTQRNILYLTLSNASISGPLPRWLQDMANVYFLDLSHNFITGPLTNLPYQLQTLFLQNNHLNGSIPKSLCKITSIQYLDISKNRLSGELPQCLEKLQSLQVLILSSNRLSGLIPSLSFPSLLWLQLSNNTFQGQLPSSIGKSRDLQLIDIGENNFFGPIPEWLGEKHTWLVVLRLHKNNFNGSIPRRLCQSSNIQIFDLAHNNLTGTIPRCFGAFAGMTTPTSRLLGNSRFETTVIEVMNGVVNEYTTILGYLVNMDLSSNNLVGEIPKELTSCSELLGLNLSHNHLSGGIPNEIGNMKGLQSLDLSGNKLSGSIPSSIAKLTFLSHLNVSYNNFSGQIPSGNQMQTLNDPLIYAGNEGLCGEPLPKKCSDNHDPTSPSATKKNKEKDDGPRKLWFYLDIMSGFATGFWGIIGVLIFKKLWRQALFRFVEITVDKIYVAIVVRVARLKRGRETI